MNTAARMESNGVRGRIHVSEATRDELVAKGKGNWVTAREDKIVAKGKGEMQTYFVTPSYRPGSAQSSQPRSSFGHETSAEMKIEEASASLQALDEALGHKKVDPALVDSVAAELERVESGPSAVSEEATASLTSPSEAPDVHKEVDPAVVDYVVAAELGREESGPFAI